MKPKVGMRVYYMGHYGEIVCTEKNCGGTLLSYIYFPNGRDIFPYQILYSKDKDKNLTTYHLMLVGNSRMWRDDIRLITEE
jgi:hypothetical protein